VIVTDAVAVTAVVVTVKVADLEPAAMVTLAGTVTPVILDASFTTIPPVGAIPFRVTVPVADVPPTTEFGETVTPVSVGGAMARVAVFDVPLAVAVIVGLLAAVTAIVVMLKVALDVPDATVIEPGTVALELLDESATVIPPDGAGPFNVIVPTELLPPTTEAGFNPSDAIAGGLSDTVPTWEIPFSVPVICAETKIETGVVEIVNVPVVAPAGTVAVPVTVAFGVLETKAIEAPPAPAGPFRVRVPVAAVPPVTVAGEMVSPVSVAGLIVKVPVFDTVPWLPVIVTGVAVATPLVVIENVPVVEPAGTVTEAGGVALLELEVRLIVAPPVGAAADSVTVPVADVPPVTEAGATVRPVSCAETIDRVAV